MGGPHPVPSACYSTYFASGWGMEHPEGDRVLGGVKVRTQEGKGRGLRAKNSFQDLKCLWCTELIFA